MRQGCLILHAPGPRRRFPVRGLTTFLLLLLLHHHSTTRQIKTTRCQEKKAPWHSAPHSYRSPLPRLRYSAIYGLCVQHRDRLSCPLPLQPGCICDPGLCARLRTVDHRRELCRAAVVSTGGRSALITGRTVNQVEELEVGTVRCAFTSTLARGYRRIPRSLTPTRDPTPALLAITRAKRAAFFPGITI